jgi:hypothetical protein
MWETTVTETYRRGPDDVVLAAWLSDEDRDRVREHRRLSALAKLRDALPRRSH